MSPRCIQQGHFGMNAQQTQDSSQQSPGPANGGCTQLRTYDPSSFPCTAGKPYIHIPVTGAWDGAAWDDGRIHHASILKMRLRSSAIILYLISSFRDMRCYRCSNTWKNYKERAKNGIWGNVTRLERHTRDLLQGWLDTGRRFLTASKFLLAIQSPACFQSRSCGFQKQKWIFSRSSVLTMDVKPHTNGTRGSFHTSSAHL